jgi:Protein of unknown function (DUF3300)
LIRNQIESGTPLLFLAVGWRLGRVYEKGANVRSRNMRWHVLPTRLTATVCVFLLFSAPAPAVQAGSQSQTGASESEAPKIPADQLDSLVAPIALYPDPVLAQVLAASTYPLELIQLQQWLSKNPNLKDKALTEAVQKQPWDASVQAMAVLPDVVKRLTDDIQWTTDLGNAVLAQQSDVMDAVQRMRAKAKEKGNLKSTEQQKVETKVVESKQVIVIQQASPEVVYVPSYNPTVVYGPPVYPYPPVTYPPPGYYAAGAAISFGVGMMVGAAMSGGWGWNCGWGGNNDINVNVNNNFNRNTNINGGNRNNVSGGNRANVGNGNSSWKHNAQHRGGTPYADRNTANKFGGTARGDSMANRQNDARQRQQGNVSNRATAGAGDRAGSRGGSGDNRPSASTNDRSGNRGGAGDRPSAASSDRSGNRGGGGGGDRVGDRSVSSGANASNRGAFGGSSASGSSARKSSSRGAASMGSSGGRSRGGGRRR